MNKLVALLAGIAFSVAATSAMADEAAGTIAAVDQTTGTVVLEDGTAFAMGEGLSMDGLAPGTEVTVSYEDQGGILVATEIAPSN